MNTNILVIMKKGDENKIIDYLLSFKHYVSGNTFELCLHIPKGEILRIQPAGDYSDNNYIGTYLEFHICDMCGFNYYEILKVEKKSSQFFITKYAKEPLNNSYKKVHDLNEYGFKNGICNTGEIDPKFFNEFQIRNVITPDGNFWNRNYCELKNGEILSFQQAIGITTVQQLLKVNSSNGKFFFDKNSTVPFFDLKIWNENWEELFNHFQNIYKDHHAVVVSLDGNIHIPNYSHYKMNRGRRRGKSDFDKLFNLKVEDFK